MPGKIKIISIIALLILSGLFYFGCTPSFRPDNWVQNISNIGSSSSPQAIDLNKDGIKDIVLGGGGKEFVPTDAAVIALDGKDGQLLWKTPGRNQVVSTAIFQDINDDDVPDVFMGGRSAIFYALNGSDGTVLWEYQRDDESTDYFNDTTILNFYNPQWVPDIDGDAYQDVLTAYGGFVKAKPGETKRPRGYLMLMSGKSGKVLSKVAVPDGKETYLSPIVYDFNKTGDLEVIFGTGGENIEGNLYRVALKAIEKGDLSNATILLQGNGKGFIAPPILIDVNLDKTADIVINSVDGQLFCLDGKNNKILWQVSLDGQFDTYTMPAPGYFTGNDLVPDFFSSFGKGPWPDTKYTVHTLTDGKTGKVVFQDTLGTFQYASPVVFDFTNDGQQDVLLAINRKVAVENSPIKLLGNELILYPGGQGKPELLDQVKLGSNLGSTPLITDLDGDQRLDLIFNYMSDANQFYSFKNLRIERLELKEKFVQPKWGGYMGQGVKSIVEE